jgi:hypothetical protein
VAAKSDPSSAVGLLRVAESAWRSSARAGGRCWSMRRTRTRREEEPKDRAERIAGRLRKTRGSVNDPNLFRRGGSRRAAERMRRARRWTRAAVRRALARVMGDRALLRVGPLDGLAAGLEESCGGAGRSERGRDVAAAAPPGPCGPTERRRGRRDRPPAA